MTKFKKIFSSQEVQDFKKEVKQTAGNLQKEVQEVASKAVSKTKETTESITSKTKSAQEAIEQELRTDGLISFDDFLKVEVKVGTILSVIPVEKSEKLLLLSVDTGDATPRQIVSGIKTYFEDPQSLVNRQAMFVTNLEPRTIFGHESQGMIFALNDKDNFSILEPDTKIVPGTRAS